MPSSSKTTTLRLNQFAGSDKPKMDDFNYDNTQLETLVGGHLTDAQKHLTQAEREEWFRPASTLFSYAGDNAEQRSFTLEFAPRFCTVVALDMPPTLNDMFSPAIVMCYQASAAQNGQATVGVSLSGNTLTVYNDPDGGVDQIQRRFNTEGITYLCHLFR